MIFTPLTQHAIDVAARCHARHVRIGLDLPYIVHPYSVALITAEYEPDEETFCAALLHDVIEDADGYTREMMRGDFGDAITDIVLSITEDKTGTDDLIKLKQNWEWRKRGYLGRLRQAPRKALLICAADSIHNLTSLLQLEKLHGDAYAGSFGATMDKKVWFYGEIMKVLHERLDSPIVERLRSAYTTFTCSPRITLCDQHIHRPSLK